MEGPLFGLETEVLATGFGAGGSRFPRRLLLERMMGAARERLPYVNAAAGGGIFLQNGMKLYVDSGEHPEICTPECSDPTDLVRYVLAGDRILSALASEILEKSSDLEQVIISKCGVDYGGACGSWGCHESYLYTKPSRGLGSNLIPFLASRIVFTGAGGFDNRFPGVRFLLSPRVRHLSAVRSGESTGRRGIYHSKDEPLAASRYGRLHVLCGESTSSPRATWLKVGTTSLVVQAIQARRRPGRSFRLLQPLEAMRSFARDATCTCRVPLASGEEVTAIQIQRGYLDTVEECIGEGIMPDWAPDVCASWRQVLDALQGYPNRVDGVLDWRVKRALYGGWALEKGFSEDDVEGWNRVVAALQADARSRRSPRTAGRRSRPVDAAALTVESLPVVAPILREWALSKGDFEGFLALRDSLFEADTRYSVLGGRGIHDQLQRKGVLCAAREGAGHKPGGGGCCAPAAVGSQADGLVGSGPLGDLAVGDVRAATEKPPDKGRARLRGEAIRELGPDRARCKCDWNGIYNGAEQKLLDLSNPLATSARWTSVTLNSWAAALPLVPSPVRPGAEPNAASRLAVRLLRRALMREFQDLFPQSGETSEDELPF